jgi:hypothetical protein
MKCSSSSSGRYSRCSRVMHAGWASLHISRLGICGVLLEVRQWIGFSRVLTRNPRFVLLWVRFRAFCFVVCLPTCLHLAKSPDGSSLQSISNASTGNGINNLIIMLIEIKVVLFNAI